MSVRRSFTTMEQAQATMKEEEGFLDVNKFILEVEMREPLYTAGYDRFTKHTLWEEVSNAVGISVSTCIRKWKSLRDCFVKEYRLQQRLAAGVVTARKNKRVYVYYDRLSFLLPTLTPKVRSSLALTCDTGMAGMEVVSCPGPTSNVGGMKVEIEEVSWPDEEDEIAMGGGDDVNSSYYRQEQSLSPPPAAPDAPMVIEGQFSALLDRVAAAAQLSMDEDALFFQSLLPSFRRLRDDQKSLLKIRISQLVHETLYCLPPGHRS